MSCLRNGVIINPTTDVGVVTTGTTGYAFPSQWAAPYVPAANSDFKVCLPSGAPFPRSTSGVDPTVVNNHITTVLTKFVYTVDVPRLNDYDPIPTANATAPGLSNTSPTFAKDNINPALAFAKAAKKLRDNLEDEYCFYSNRYSKLLLFILTIAASATGNLSDAKYIEAKTLAELINRKLNDLILILQKLNDIRYNELQSGYYATDAGVNQSNNKLREAKAQLDSNLALLNNSELKTDIQSAMMEYTIEKNQSSRNLLAIYGFMNIVAVGMLYYLYRNIK